MKRESESHSVQSCLTLCNPMDRPPCPSPAPSCVQFSRPEYWSGQSFPSPEDLPNPGIKPTSPELQMDSLPAEPQGKPKNTGVGSLSLLQRIFLTQESNQGLLHYGQIIYQLSYQGNPFCTHSVQFSCSVVSVSLRPHESQHARPTCPSPTPGVYSNSSPLRRWCHLTISSSIVPFSSCPQSFPASRSFPVSQFFTSGGQSIGVSASTSVLPMNIQN